jgi:RNA polymerase-interacting CarD/CdnL/TRCF family regulator
VKLEVGDVVVYVAYGVGRVVARERGPVHGAEQEVVVVELADGLSVLLPIERAREQLRPPVTATGVRRIQERLRQDGVPSLDAWPKRRQQTQAKLTGGDPLELAEVVRDGARHKQALAAKGSAQLPSGEKVLYERARQLLSAEDRHRLPSRSPAGRRLDRRTDHRASRTGAQLRPPLDEAGEASVCGPLAGHGAEEPAGGAPSGAERHSV